MFGVNILERRVSVYVGRHGGFSGAGVTGLIINFVLLKQIKFYIKIILQSLCCFEIL